MNHAVERYLAPTSLTQALAVLAESGGATVLAGGTDLMPQSRAGRVKFARTLLNIRRVPGMDMVEVADGKLLLGALVTISTLVDHPLVRDHAPLLSQAADHFASDQIRNAATLGGNLCNTSPAGDTLTPLMALDAEIELVGLDGTGVLQSRWLPLDGFFTGPGRTQRKPNELLRGVRLPVAPDDQKVAFYKAGVRPALDISTISIAFAARRRDRAILHDVRLALGAVAPTPIRARRTEALLEGKALTAELVRVAAASAASEATPIDDVRASGWYRKELVLNMTQRILEDVGNN